VGVLLSAQSVAALLVSLPLGRRHTEATTVLLSATATGSTVPSTRLTMPAMPVTVVAVIAPSYESASTRVPVVVLTRAMPSGAPFWMLFEAAAKVSFSAVAGTTTVLVATTR
jgi:hypothetical protein